MGASYRLPKPSSGFLSHFTLFQLVNYLGHRLELISNFSHEITHDIFYSIDFSHQIISLNFNGFQSAILSILSRVVVGGVLCVVCQEVRGSGILIKIAKIEHVDAFEYYYIIPFEC